jgi:hypothetical protein
LLIAAGREKEAEKSLEGLGPQGEFLRGYVAMRRRKWTDARRRFEALAREQGGSFALKASFYAAACRVLEDRGPVKPKERLTLAGLGVNPPYSATAESLRAIAGASVVFNNVMGDEMFEFLRAFCRDVRPIAYHQDGDEGRLSDEMMAEAGKKGVSAVFVTRGSAIVYGPLGTELRARCAARKLPCRTLAAVSSMESIHARLGSEPALRLGSAVADSGALDAPAWTDARVPLTAYLSLEKGDGSYARFCAGAVAARGPEASCAVYDHVIGQEPLSWRAGELAPRRAELSVSAIVHFPGGGKA